jgi:hypothetical protein
MFVNRQDAESVMVVGLAGRRDSPTNGDKAYFRLDLNDSDNGPTEFTCIAWSAVTTTAGGRRWTDHILCDPRRSKSDEDCRNGP